MSHQTIGLVLADNDGCINPTKGTKVASHADDVYVLMKVVRHMASDNKYPAFAICTARPPAYVQGLIQTLGAYWKGVPSICEGGAVFYDPLTGDVSYNPALTASMRQRFQQVRTQVADFADKANAVIAPGRDWQASLKPRDSTRKEELFKTVVASFEHPDLKIINAPGAIDISPKGIDKGVAIDHLSKITGIPLENMLGIGDAEGDLPMFEKVGVAAGPSNATEDVISVLDYRSPHKETKGVIDILAHFAPDLKTDPRVARYVTDALTPEKVA